MTHVTPARHLSQDTFLQFIRRQHRGRFKLYLGSCPGVGKTYAMLASGNFLRSCGVDVVIGYVELHDQRPETTAQIGQLEIVQPRLVPYRGATLREMDLEALLARNPTVALVDELAHTNAPGSKKAKRYEEVQELLNAGINVVSTINVEHLESMNIIVEQTTGIHVRERVPDEVVMSADQITTMDLPSQKLLQRLKAGTIYPPEQSRVAARHFFTEMTLKRLRDMTLTWTAHYLAHKEREASAPEDTPSAPGHVAVALASRGPDSAPLLRETMRLAAQCNAPWHAVHVHTPEEAPTKIDLDIQRKISEALELAQRLGGHAVVLKDEDVARALISFAHDYNIAHMVMGRPAKGHLHHWRFRPSLIEVLTRELASVHFSIV
jgi:two-component system sensor histidine kinase KdpD